MITVKSAPDPFPFSDHHDIDDLGAPEGVGKSARPRPRHGGSVLMAAMLGLAEALGMAPEPTEVVEQAEANDDDNSLDLRFGHLPPLD